MTTIINKEHTMFFSSAHDNGALNRNPDGNQFSVQLDKPIYLPPNTIYATAEISKATIWNVSPNISEEIGNNKFQICLNGVPISPDPITIPDGLYTVVSLQTFLQNQFILLGQPANLLSFQQDTATQKVILVFGVVGTYVDFSIPNTCNDVLGFNPREVPNLQTNPNPGTTIIGQTEPADNEAKFNRIDSYIIKGNLVSDGIQVNNTFDGAMCVVPITAKAGSQIVYQPYIPERSDARELIGQIKNRIDWRLTDQLGRPVDLLSEVFNFTVIIRYVVPIQLNQMSGVHIRSNL